MKRLEDIRDSDNLGCLMKIPQAGCHPLVYKRSGQWAVKVSHNLRLVFEPADECISTTTGGAIDIEKVTRFRVLEVVDYHD